MILDTIIRHKGIKMNKNVKRTWKYLRMKWKIDMNGKENAENDRKLNEFNGIEIQI